MSRIFAIGLIALSALACDDELPPPPEDTKPIDYDGLFESDSGAPPSEVVAPPPDTPPVSKDQCDLLWAFERPEGGVPSHPLVDPNGLIALVAGDTLRRIDLNGQEASICDDPFRAPGETLGTPSQNKDGSFLVGTASGKLLSIDRKCNARWEVDINQEFGELYPDFQGANSAIWHAPTWNGESGSDAIAFVLDERPVLHQVRDLGTTYEYRAPYILEDERLRGGAPVYVGGDSPMVVVPTQRTVTAIKESGSLLWAFNDFKNDEEVERHVTSTLALTSDRRILFVAGEVAGDAYKNLQLYRLLPTSPDKQGVLDEGYPIDLGLALDNVHGLVVAADQSIYLATALNGVLRYDAQGNQLWRFVGDEESIRVTTVPTLGNDGTLYFTAQPHFFYGVDKNGARIFRYASPAGGELTSTSPAIHTDGTVLVHIGTQLQAYECPSSGLAISSWPRYQRNNRNTGNLQEVQ